MIQYLLILQTLVKSFKTFFELAFSLKNIKQFVIKLAYAAPGTENNLINTKFNITWVWVKGHASNKYNNRADELVNLARKEVTNI